jgi:hypothetical protein
MGYLFPRSITQTLLAVKRANCLLYLPLTMGIAAVGAAVLNVVELAGEHLPADVR